MAFTENEGSVPLALHKNGLHVALENGRYEEARKLIKSERADILIKCFENYEGYSPPSLKSSLHLIASLTDKDQAVRLCHELLSKVKEAENRKRLLNATVVEELTCDQQTIRARVAPVHIAVFNGNIGVVRLLCREYGVDVNCSTSETLEGTPQKGITPLYWATVKGQTELVKMLIDSTDDGVNASCTEDSDTPLHIAANIGYIELVKLLLDNKADVNASRNTGKTPLWIAVQNAHIQVVNHLLDHKAEVNASCHTDGSMHLDVAAWYGHTEIVKLLLEHKADVNASRYTDRVTPLYIAAENGNTEVVKLLLEHKADVNASCTDDDVTPLFIAAWNGHTEAVKLLLDHKADMNASMHTDCY